MHFIKKIFENKADDCAHQRFVKYSRGTYRGPALAIKFGKDIKINSTYDYSNVLFLIAGIQPGRQDPASCGGDFKVSGEIFTGNGAGDVKNWFPGELGDVDVKTAKRKGYTGIILNCALSGEQILKLYEKFNRGYIFLSVSKDSADKSGGVSLKSKKKIPKPGSDADLKFCSASFPYKYWDAIKSEILWDIDLDEKDIKNKKIKSLKIEHTYMINELVVPDEHKGDFSKARLYAKRKGLIMRNISIDGQERMVEFDMEV